jgi:hypothetical protein
MRVVYYESIKRELKIRGIYECRCDERLQTKKKEFSRLAYTGLIVELKHLKIEIIASWEKKFLPSKKSFLEDGVNYRVTRGLRTVSPVSLLTGLLAGLFSHLRSIILSLSLQVLQ